MDDFKERRASQLGRIGVVQELLRLLHENMASLNETAARIETATTTSDVTP